MSAEGPYPFNPDWTLAPAACLREWLEENGLTARELAVACASVRGRDVALRVIEDVLARKPLTERHAIMLASGTGVSARFWLNFEHNYRAGLAAGLKDTTPEDEDA